jgi:hypothetical protein
MLGKQELAFVVWPIYRTLVKLTRIQEKAHQLIVVHLILAGPINSYYNPPNLADLLFPQAISMVFFLGAESRKVNLYPSNLFLFSKRKPARISSTSNVFWLVLSDFCAPKGTRTPVLALRGPRPGPLDDGGNSAQILPPCICFVNSVKV